MKQRDRHFQRSKKIGFSLLLIAFFLQAKAQNQGPAVEQWRSFLPYYQVNALAYDAAQKIIYCATDYGFFSYNRADGSMETYSKVNGMHDIGMSDVAFDEQTGTVLLAYTDGNIDLFKDNRFSNIPDLKNSSISGDKTIYNAVCHEGIGYLSTGLGLVLINIPKAEIKVTVPFYNGSLFATVYDALVANDEIYAATSAGIFKTDIDNPFIQDYSGWDKLSAQTFRHLAYWNGHLFASEGSTVYEYQPGSNVFAVYYQAPETVVHMDAASNGLWVSSNADTAAGHSYLVNGQGQKTDSLPCQSPAAVLAVPGGSVWYADNSDYHYPSNNGLRERISATESKSYTPDGPVAASSYDISAYEGTIWVAHGGYNDSWNGVKNRAMFSVYKDNHWKNFSWLSDNAWVQDFVRILYNPADGHTYAGSLTGGLVDVAPDLSFQNFGAGYLPPTYGSTDLFSVSGMALDASGNLWMSSNGGQHELTVRTTGGKWYGMNPVANNIGGNLPHSAADVLVDDYGQLWFMTTQSNGVVVYNDNGTPENTADDSYRLLRTGEGNGNLPSNSVLCLAKTKDGAIWIGTADGIGIVNCPGQVIEHQCEASLKAVQFDEYADYLFARQAVNALAVDGAGRVWVGTGNGAWLLSSESGDIKVVYRFTTDNSPLPSDNIQRINIDPVTGDVYFSTDKGFIAFRSTATEASETAKSSILVYPNPVPSGYHGMIAVRGLPENSDVRFTDITGKLVYRANANGGEAVWNGADYTGHKVQSGVYLVFVVSKDGTEKETAKLIIQK
ncbi:MAG TPA: two-component regulator propeller domain-containing protein [Edaphocola sp.]|nr:two-component regulator propeller domain-containing protein [Edaphocola sp.]